MTEQVNGTEGGEICGMDSIGCKYKEFNWGYIYLHSQVMSVEQKIKSSKG